MAEEFLCPQSCVSTVPVMFLAKLLCNVQQSAVLFSSRDGRTVWTPS